MFDRSWDALAGKKVVCVAGKKGSRDLAPGVSAPVSNPCWFAERGRFAWGLEGWLIHLGFKLGVLLKRAGRSFVFEIG